MDSSEKFYICRSGPRRNVRFVNVDNWQSDANDDAKEEDENGEEVDKDV